MRKLRRSRNREPVENEFVMTEEHSKFIDAFIKELHAPRAAQEAGSELPYVDGNEWLSLPEVQAEIIRRYNEYKKQFEITPERTLRELSFIAYGNMKDLRDENGFFLPIHEMPREITAAIKKMICVIDESETENEDGSITLNKKTKWIYEVWDKPRAINDLMRYHGHFEKDNRQKGLDWEILSSILQTVLSIIPIQQQNEVLGILRQALEPGGEKIIDLLPERV